MINYYTAYANKRLLVDLSDKLTKTKGVIHVEYPDGFETMGNRGELVLDFSVDNSILNTSCVAEIVGTEIKLRCEYSLDEKSIVLIKPIGSFKYTRKDKECNTVLQKVDYFVRHIMEINIGESEELEMYEQRVFKRDFN